MKRNAIAVLFSLVSLMATSCTKMDALFNNGEPVTEQRSVNRHFSAIAMYNNVNVNLVQSHHPRLELTCPKNLIEKVTTEVRGDSLIIKNENDYNWLRSYDYDIDLTVYYDSLREITYASIGHLLSTDSIKGFGTQVFDTITSISPDSTSVVIDSIDSHWNRSFVLRIKEGSGDIDLCFDCDILKTVFSFGTSKVALRGIAGYTEHYVKSYGCIHAEALNSNIVKVMSESTNDIYVWARGQLFAHLSSIGNVYYKGYPWIEKTCDSEGEVLKLE
ncbi:MAG: DUF2807 domain-containing protein [Bacteroidales bacterium]|nr:DUF2807 domain-containing protein [Bacteroidales bacterium]